MQMLEHENDYYQVLPQKSQPAQKLKILHQRPEERQTRRALNPDSLNPNTCPTGTAHVVEGDEVPQGEVEGDGLPPVNAGAFLDTIGFYCCLFGPNANSSAHASASSS